MGAGAARYKVSGRPEQRQTPSGEREGSTAAGARRRGSATARRHPAQAPADDMDAVAGDSAGPAHAHAHSEAAQDTCAICTDVIDEAVRCRTFPCLHAFCIPCLKTWISRKNTCPLCAAAVAYLIVGVNEDGAFATIPVVSGARTHADAEEAIRTGTAVDFIWAGRPERAPASVTLGGHTVRALSPPAGRGRRRPPAAAALPAVGEEEADDDDDAGAPPPSSDDDDDLDFVPPRAPRPRVRAPRAAVVVVIGDSPPSSPTRPEPRAPPAPHPRRHDAPPGRAYRAGPADSAFRRLRRPGRLRLPARPTPPPQTSPPARPTPPDSASGASSGPADSASGADLAAADLAAGPPDAAAADLSAGPRPAAGAAASRAGPSCAAAAAAAAAAASRAGPPWPAAAGPAAAAGPPGPGPLLAQARVPAAAAAPRGGRAQVRPQDAPLGGPARPAPPHALPAARGRRRGGRGHGPVPQPDADRGLPAGGGHADGRHRRVRRAGLPLGGAGRDAGGRVPGVGAEDGPAPGPGGRRGRAGRARGGGGGGGGGAGGGGPRRPGRREGPAGGPAVLPARRARGRAELL
ncbi:immediate early protein ICP0 [Leporid alphaherpesvirus 4]|uniref:Immediate early protein ICP0 n=1 Tax=Leporid alphaherpesvirus 4 TaxID=481315 RepID=J9R096_9ALPH|nr:immediate early protein ICP0 [Leporid alphaherpesvirus 4]AFR32502.1 immediate early protein ICP0 [Leporid alphaherpesvirus 4]